MFINFTIDDIVFARLKEELNKKDLLQKQGFYSFTVADIVGALLIKKADEESSELSDKVKSIANSAPIQSPKEVN
jgi:hypothetical protein